MTKKATILIIHILKTTNSDINIKLATKKYKSLTIVQIFGIQAIIQKG
jgi:uncharacterized membrane protein